MLDFGHSSKEAVLANFWGLYLHVPYCRRACPYCDFHFSTRLGTMEAMVAAYQVELRLRAELLRGSIQSLYVGGGTPSLLGAKVWTGLRRALALYAGFSSLREFTLEANPDDVNKEALAHWRHIGVNRLSIGVQSFQDSVLGFLGRIHNGEKAYNSVSQAMEAGFRSVSMDLMYGIPGVRRALFQSDVRQAVALAPTHISAYVLTIEPNTVFGRRAAQGKWTHTNEDEVAWQYEWLSDYLEAQGYHHYEVSNFAKGKKEEALHNRSYWGGNPYLGIGPGAHSYNGASLRWHNTPNNAHYIRALRQGVLPPGRAEQLSAAQRWREYLITGLRTKKGITLSHATELGLKLNPAYEPTLKQLIDEELLSCEGKRIRATKKGWLVVNKLIEVFYI